MAKINVWQSSSSAPLDKGLWLKDGYLKYFGNNGWSDVKYNVKVPSIPEATLESLGTVKKAVKETTLKKSAELPEVINKLNAVINRLVAAGLME